MINNFRGMFIVYKDSIKLYETNLYSVIHERNPLNINEGTLNTRINFTVSVMSRENDTLSEAILNDHFSSKKIEAIIEGFGKFLEIRNVWSTKNHGGTIEFHIEGIFQHGWNGIDRALIRIKQQNEF